MLTASNVQLNADIIKGLQRVASIVEPIKLNLINGSVGDYTTYYNMVGGGKEFITSIPIRNSFAIQVTVSVMEGVLTGTLDIYGSIDNNNWALISPISVSRITLSANGTYGWTKDLCNYDFIKVVYTANGCTGGRLLLLMTLK
jgi:hypothetical protein